MKKSVFLLIVFLFVGCGKPLVTYNYEDALLIKKSILHRKLGNLSRQTKNEIIALRQFLKSKTITEKEFRLQKKEIKEYQQYEIKRIQDKFKEYKNQNQKKK